jgi:hypothetical protein
MTKDNIKNGEHGENVLKLTINGISYEWHLQYITGAEIKKLGKIDNDDELFLAIKKPWDDEPISDQTQVNLARPEIEHFFSKEKPCEIELIVNGKPKPWKQKTITFEQVVVLAFGTYDPNPDKVYTVTYDRGPHQNPEGTMVRGGKVITKNKMIFNVTATDKS